MTLEVRDNGGKTPLMLASFRGRRRVVMMLLAKRVHVNVQDNSGWTSLMYAAFTGRIAICRELLEHASIRILTEYKQGKTAADLARDAGYYEVADVLENKEVVICTPSLPDGHYMPRLRPTSQSTISTQGAPVAKTPQPAWPPATQSSTQSVKHAVAMYPTPQPPLAAAHQTAMPLSYSPQAVTHAETKHYKGYGGASRNPIASAPAAFGSWCFCLTTPRTDCAQ
ncbi:hypothetical protein FBU59_002201 [Linderina macrospora]|uniref:Uncharacterized protein n=1 Tax=Linderina macrospora TaxID=4868 RepID=A0ACC1JBW5_9FUNG|nr:hypothetical protein FBU59_002201 [Linderina macrospora]